jgi:hypothetical protein
MCKRWFLLALLGLGIGLAVSVDRPASADDDADRIAKLVKQLGSTRFAERDRAKRELEALGATALDALRQAARSKDPETSRRAGELVKKMEEKTTLANLLAPKRVRLNVKEKSVIDAVAELSRQSGYSIQVAGDRAALANRKITLDTGDTTFWQALDQLCQKAGLVETTAPYGRPVPQPLPPIRIQPAPAPIVQPGAKPAPVPLPAPAAPPADKPALQQPQPGAVQLRIEVKVEAVQVAAPAPGQAQAAPAPAQPAPRQGAPAPGVQPAQPVQPAPVQIQPAPPVQIQPGVIGRPSPLRPTYNPNQITLAEGKRQETPTSYSGAVRVRVADGVPQQFGAVPAPQKRAGEALILLEVSPEPRLQNFQLLGGVQIEKAVDDQGQKLSVPMEPMPGEVGGVVGPGGAIARPYPGYNPYNVFNRYTYVRLKLGEKQAKALQELSGHLSAQMLSPPQALITVTDVLKSGGKKFEGTGGGKIELLGVEKQGDGSYKVQFRLENPPNHIATPFQGPVAPVGAMPVNGPGAGVQVVPGGAPQPLPRGGVVRPIYNTHGLPTLVDAKGKSWQLTQPPQRVYRANPGGPAIQEVTMVFRAHDGQGAPDQLILHGQRNISVQVPFTLRDVTLP